MSEFKTKPDHSYLLSYEINLFVDWVMRQWTAADRSRFSAEFPALYNKLVGQEVNAVVNRYSPPVVLDAEGYGTLPAADDPRWDRIIKLLEDTYATRGIISAVKETREVFKLRLKDSKEALEAQMERRGMAKGSYAPKRTVG